MELNLLVHNEHLDEVQAADARRLIEDELTPLPAHATMLDVVMMLGVFKSRTQAKGNGWEGKEIPNGYSEWTIGKLKHRVFIFKPFAMEATPFRH